MTDLEKHIITTKWQNGSSLSEKEKMEMAFYPNKENSIIVDIIKAGLGVSYNGKNN